MTESAAGIHVTLNSVIEVSCSFTYIDQIKSTKHELTDAFDELEATEYGEGCKQE